MHALHVERLEILLALKAAEKLNLNSHIADDGKQPQDEHQRSATNAAQYYKLGNEPTLTILRAVAQCCFTETTKAAAAAALAVGDPRHCSLELVFMKDVWGLLVQDCADAMEWCLEKDKYFHPANYR